MTIDAAVTTVQLTYPQVYHACHTRHQRKRTTEYALSARDSAILAHCGVDSPVLPAKLARNLLRGLEVGSAHFRVGLQRGEESG